MWFTGVAEATGKYNRERFVFPNSSIQNADGSYVANTSVATQDGDLGAWDTNLRTIGENFVTSGEFWKLKSFRFPMLSRNLFCRARNISSASVGLVGRNLFMWLPSENKYSDPGCRWYNQRPGFERYNQHAVNTHLRLQCYPRYILIFNECEI